MCFRCVFWEETEKSIPQQSAQSRAGASVSKHAEKSQTASARRPLPPFLESGLDFLKGMSGLRSSST